MEKAIPLIGLFKNPVSVGLFTAVSSVFFAVNYYAMAHLPGSRDLTCVIGGNLTTLGVIFSILLSITAGFLAAGMWEKTQLRTQESGWKMGSASGAGIVLGSITSFCTICTLPLVGLLGIGSAMTFVSEHQLLFKAVSLVLMSGGLYVLNQQLKNECTWFCKTE